MVPRQGIARVSVLLPPTLPRGNDERKRYTVLWAAAMIMGEKGRVRRVILASPSSLAFFGD